MVPINNLTTTEKRRKQRVYSVTLAMVFLLATGGSLVYWCPPSLQDIGGRISSVVGKMTRNSAGDSPAEPVLRGAVYDRSLKELAVSYRLYTVTAHPAEMEGQQEVASMLADILGEERSVIQGALKSPRRMVTLADDLDEQQAEAINKLGAAGVYCTPSEVRYYPGHTSGAQILGYVDDGVGLYGVEGKYDTVLQPGEFRNTAVRDVDFRDAKVLGRSTTDVVLTLDIELQRRLEKRLRSYLKEQDAAKAMGMLIEPFTGRILAAMSLPAFNPNYFWQVGEQVPGDMVYRHKLEKELVQPLLSRAAAIDRDGPTRRKMLPVTVASPDYGVDDQESALFDYKLKLFDPVFDAWQAEGAAGMQREAAGRRGNTLTGAQITTAIASMVNGGWRIKPHVLHGIYDHATDAMYVKTKELVERQHVLEPASGIVLRRELFRDQVHKEGQREISSLHRYRDVRMKQGLSRYVSQELYVGMAPAAMPKYLLVMAVDKERLDPSPASPRQKESPLTILGKAVLADVVAAGAQLVVDVPKERSKENFHRFLISRRLDYQEAEMGVSRTSREMPELTGLSLRKALQRLNQHQVRVRVQGSGIITAQVPAPGKVIVAGRECVLTLESEI